MSTESAVMFSEYSQWKLAQKLLRRIKLHDNTQCCIPGNDAKHFCVDKIFGRWLQVMQHCDSQQLDDRHPLFPRQPLSDSTSKSEMVRMLQECFKDMNSERASCLVEELLQDINTFITEGEHEFSGTQVSYSADKISIGDYNSPQCFRIYYLVRKFGWLSTALVCLRYDPLNKFLGGESGLSKIAFDALYDIGQARYEGFASPLNSGLLGRADTKFCSLFKDTDSAFGSLGNFFHIKMADHPGGWILSPPFVEQVLESTAHRVIETLENCETGSFWFFVLFPKWEDFSGWRILDESKWKVAKFEFEPKKLAFRDCFDRPGLTSKDPMCVFVIGELPDGVDLIKLCRKLN